MFLCIIYYSSYNTEQEDTTPLCHHYGKQCRVLHKSPNKESLYFSIGINTLMSDLSQLFVNKRVRAL
jgi:hypothetical protein